MALLSVGVNIREVVRWRVEREADHLAVTLFDAAIQKYGAPTVVHADSGAEMTSHLLRKCLTFHGVGLSHNRPYVSNGNPFSVSGFRTMKYRRGIPESSQTSIMRGRI